ncbi:MAG: hypothetical protein K8T25_12520 [Planctomycetia bacterium]|nr:hypothetical protein [Planctomycetia bacterium]
MPATYAKLGIRFDYPDNWTIDEDEARATRNAVTVYAPGGAFWSVLVLPSEVDPAAEAATAVETMRADYDEIDVEPIEEQVEGWDLAGFDLNFYCLDLTNTAQIRAFNSPFGTYMILVQAEDREFQQLELVFRAITVSMLRHLRSV